MKGFTSILLSFLLFCIPDLFSQSNVDFETTTPGAYFMPNAVSGWTLSSQSSMQSSCNTLTWTPVSPEFSIIATPLVTSSPISAILPVIPNSPLGGAHIACLNNTTANNSATKLSRSFWVTPANSLFQYAFAGAWENCQSLCCEAPGFKVQVKDQSGQLLSCLTSSLSSSIGCSTSSNTYSVAPSGVFWTNWQVRTIDLSAFMSSLVTIEIISYDCVYSSHYGTLYFDAISLPALSNVNYCPGSNQAILSGPAGFATYSWTAPPGSFLSPSQVTQNSVAISNPIPGAVYSLNLTSWAGCSFITTYTIAATQVSISTVLSNASCIGGSTGTATVFVNGSSIGYSYTWLDANNSIVSNTNAANNLAAGIYSITVTAPGSQSLNCGTAMTTVTLGSFPGTTTNLYKPFCGNEAYLWSPVTGTNYQWYHNTSSPPISTSSSYTVVSPTHMDVYTLTYQNPHGCIDTIKYNLGTSTSGFLNITNNPQICSGANNGIATISILPTQGTMQGMNYFYVTSTGTTSTYTASVDPTPLNTFSISGLSEGTYSINAFDGACKYSTTLTVTAFAFDYTTSPASATVCQGNSVQLNVDLDSTYTPGQFSYSWTPNANMFGSTSQVAILIPSISVQGSVATTIYTVIVTPYQVNCPLTKTISITIANPLIPTIGLIPPLCSGSLPFTISANPPGGQFETITGLSTNGVITPMVATIGSNTFTYTPPPLASCSITTTGTFLVNPDPNIIPSGAFNICSGQTTTLSLPPGNLTYSWSTGSNSTSIMLSPNVTSTYTLLETNPATSCSTTLIFTVTVVQNPTLVLSGNTSLCHGGSTSLTVSGANSYTWSNNSTNASLVLSPTTSSTYTVTGSNSPTCSAQSLTFGLTVLPTPTLTISGNATICEGESVLLNGNGASTYSWNNGMQTQTFSASPVATTAYTLYGTNSANCSSAKTITVTVSDCTGIKATYKSSVNIYPNPTSEKLFIETPYSVKLSLSDAMGRILLSTEVQPAGTYLDLKDYPDGIYFLNLITSSSTEIIKVVKTK